MKTQHNRFTLLLLAVFFITNLSFAQRDRDEDKGDEFHLDKVYEMSATGTLNLNTEDADVRIVGSNRSDVHVKIDRVVTTRGVSSRSRSFDVDVENRNGDLFIRESKGRSRGFIGVGYFRTDYDILIELPEGASLRVRGEDDDYYVKNVNGAIEMETEDGDIELVDCNGSDFEFILEDGDLKLDGGKGKFYARLDDGDIDMINGGFDNVEIQVEDGNVTMETGIADNGVYDIRADDARIDFVVLSGGGDFRVTKDDGRVRATSDFETIRENDYRSELKLAGGKADVQIRTNDGSVRLSKR